MIKKSKLIIGCMSWGQWGKKLSDNEQIGLINFCVEHGNITFDHADIYGDYTTEKEFGKAFRQSSINRTDIKLISKCGIQYVGDTRKNKIKHYNYTKEYIIWSAENALTNLKTDYLDTFLLHRPSPLMHPHEIAEAITHLQESGKIIEFGVSNFTPSQVELIANMIKVSVNQIEFSLTQHKAMHDGTLDQMLQKNIQPMSWSPLGTIFKEDNAKISNVKVILKTLAEKYDVSETAILLSWILKHPANISPIIGTTNKNRIINANKAFQINLEQEDWFTLLVAWQGFKVP